MRINTLFVVTCLAVVGIASPASAQSELVIDDFKESPYWMRLTDYPTFLTEYQTGSNIIGGVRQTNFTVSQGSPLFGQSTLLQIRRNGSLVISGGYKSYFGLYLGYGYDATGGANRLDLDLSGNGSRCPACDRFRIDFDGSDSELSYVMQVYDSNNNITSLFGTESLAERILPFHVDFPFAEFVGDPAQPVDWNHIDFIVVLFQTGNYLGGHDFAIKKITATAPNDEQ